MIAINFVILLNKNKETKKTKNNEDDTNLINKV